jgi:hypothetical protein
VCFQILSQCAARAAALSRSDTGGEESGPSHPGSVGHRHNGRCRRASREGLAEARPARGDPAVAFLAGRPVFLGPCSGDGERGGRRRGVAAYVGAGGRRSRLLRDHTGAFFPSTPIPILQHGAAGAPTQPRVQKHPSSHRLAVVEHSNPDTCWLLHHELVCCVYTLSEILFCFGIVERAF